MTRDIQLLPAADVEIMEARDWYEGERAGLGDRFLAEVRYQLGRIADHPDQFQRVRKDARRSRLRVFPYVIIYREDAEAIYVLACLHTSRNPAIWQGRL